ncbi:MAG: SEL1-like repeat protein [Planctomycetes bacterium]|nr:SEL1-like repeat protein [Planctomycetota bacterium]
MRERIGPYEVLEELARGGQGAVLKARHTELETIVALKVLLDPDAEGLARFQQEGRVLARLRHPNLVRIDALGELRPGAPYMAMEFVRGQDLADWVRQAGTPSLEALESVLNDVARTLHYCHENGIVHRDVKPQNVMIESGSKRTLLVDFGLIRRDRLRLAWSTQDAQSLTQEGTTLGTPAYMPPEQVSAEFGQVDRRSDVYALGALLYFLLTGEQPFSGASLINVLIQVLEASPPDPRRINSAIPPALAELCMQCMAKSMDDRPLSAEVFADELRASLEGPVNPRRVRAPGLALALLGGAVMLSLLATFLLLRSDRDDAHRLAGTPSPAAIQPSLSPPRPSPTETAEELFQRGAAYLRANRSKEALGLFRRAAELGDVRAMLDLGTLLSNERRVTKDPTLAAKWYRRAAEAGNADGMYKLAVVLQKGLGVPQDEAQAAEWSRRAADQGCVEAMYQRGILFEQGLRVPKDEAQAADWYRRAGEQGNVKALLNLGVMLLRGQGIPSDEARAKELFRRAAKRGNARAMWNLGLIFDRGSSATAKDASRALEWYRRAAEAGSTGAMSHLADLLSEGRGVERDLSQAAAWLRRGAEAGDPGGMFRLAVALQRGAGVEKDVAEAMRWYLAAAEGGHTVAMSNLGVALVQGILVPKDLPQALVWLRRAADGGNTQAMFNLGALLGSGDGGTKDEAEAVEWFRRAAEAGHQRGAYSLALMLRDGRGVARDRSLAGLLFRRCAEEGNKDAMFNLALLLERGQGIPEDMPQAVEWYRKASQSTDPRTREAAQAALERLGK